MWDVPLILVGLGLLLGLFNSLQFISMNTMAYADVGEQDVVQASTLASTLQQMSLSFGLALGSLVTACHLGDQPQTSHVAVMHALHHALLTLAAWTWISSLSFWGLRRTDGESITRGGAA